jgi:hypothetical protein
LSELTLATNRIEEELKKTNPSKKKILNHLYDLQLYDFEFLNLIGETYKLNPLFFMKTLYSNIWKKMGKLLGNGGRNRAERYIIENYCLHGGEEILYECEGSIKKLKPLRKPFIKLKVSLGIIFITNHRIIAQGKLIIEELVRAKTRIPNVGSGLGGGEEYRKEKKFSFEASELCFGYVFPVKHLSNLKRSGQKLSYEMVDGIAILTAKKGQIEKVFDILNQFKK